MDVLEKKSNPSDRDSSWLLNGCSGEESNLSDKRFQLLNGVLKLKLEKKTQVRNFSFLMTFCEKKSK
jgi:hypothetical protein